MKNVRVVIAIVAVAALGLVVAACTGGGGSREESGSAAAPAITVTGDAVRGVEKGAIEADVGAVAAPTEAAPSAGDLTGAQPIDIAQLPEIGPRVIQTASLTLSVPKGSFDTTIDSARTIASSFGGFVTSSSASQGTDQRLVRGTLVVRIPERSYAQAMSQLSKLGKVQGREESGQDVSQQYVDLQARERNLEAVERQLLTFLNKTTTVADALVVQDRLNQVQLQLEEVRGQLRYLDDQTTFATISLSVAERGVVVAKPKDDGGWGITDAWRAAAHGFMKVIGGAFVGVATAAPALLALALAFLGWRYLVRRRQVKRHAGSALG